MSEKILKQFQDIIREYSGKDDLVITEKSSLVNDLELSSLDIISLIGSIEDTFNIEIEDEDVVKMVTVGDVVDYIISKTK